MQKHPYACQIDIEAARIAHHFGRQLCVQAFCSAIARFDPNPEDFDANGNLTIDGAHYLARLITSSLHQVVIVSELLADNLTRDKINCIRLTLTDVEPLNGDTLDEYTDNEATAKTKHRTRRPATT